MQMLHHPRKGTSRQEIESARFPGFYFNKSNSLRMVESEVERVFPKPKRKISCLDDRREP